jgi:hypothetical protein
MVDMDKNKLKLAGWVTIILILDVVVYFFLLLIWPNLWLSMGAIFALLAIGTVVSYLIGEKIFVYRDNNLGKLAGVLGTVIVSLNAVFCIIISSLIIIGLFIASTRV